MELDKSDNKSQKSDDDVVWIEDIARVLDNADFSAILKDQDGENNDTNVANRSKTGQNNGENVATCSKTGEENTTNAPKDLIILGNKPSQDSRPRSFWGRGYGPHAPPTPKEHENVGFLIRCGVMKNTLKGIPNVLLDLMGPNYCGVCALSIDQMDFARLHYTSKNHVKSQKRWLAQQTKVGLRNPKEVPMRARELYCELCDIYITSKSHADSHYSGRPHRSIVEGHRLPKNAFLLQANMRGRVDQLIRREKKCLRNASKSAEIEKAQAEAKVVHRPDLYCEICKTSVTNREQMTMHLNGKKHLKNEKNHILRMMKSGVERSERKDTAKPQPDASKDVDAHDANVNEVDYDWGDGSGPWDDDPQ